MSQVSCSFPANEPFHLCTAKGPILSEVNSMGKDPATLPPLLDNEDCMNAVTCGLCCGD